MQSSVACSRRFVGLHRVSALSLHFRVWLPLGNSFRKPSDCTPSWECCLWGATRGGRAALSPGLCEIPGKAVPPSSVANGGTSDSFVVTDGKAGVQLMASLDLVTLCVLQVPNFPNSASPQGNQTPSKVSCCGIFAPCRTPHWLGAWCLTFITWCHICHHPKSLGISLPSALSSPCFKRSSAHTASPYAGGPRLVFWPRRNK